MRERFVIATQNQHKVTEFQRILEPLGIEATTASLSDVEETGTTFMENARLKAKAAMEETGLPAVADDSGLEVDALNGEPGVFTARYAGPGATDLDKMNKVLRKLGDCQNRGARFVSAICLMYPDGRTVEALGACEGTIGFAPLGENGFGYDPIFVTADGRTMAQLTGAEKDALSHRGNALRILAKKLQEA